jgi:hypothetical protein
MSLISIQRLARSMGFGRNISIVADLLGPAPTARTARSFRAEARAAISRDTIDLAFVTEGDTRPLLDNLDKRFNPIGIHTNSVIWQLRAADLPRVFARVGSDDFYPRATTPKVRVESVFDVAGAEKVINDLPAELRLRNVFFVGHGSATHGFIFSGQPLGPDTLAVFKPHGATSVLKLSLTHALDTRAMTAPGGKGSVQLLQARRRSNIMAKTFSEAVHILDGDGSKIRISLENNAIIRVGANGAKGYLAVYSSGADSSDLEGAPSIVIDGGTASLWIGTRNIAGEILMFPNEVDQSDPKRASIQLDGQNAALRMGGGGKAGHIFLVPSQGDAAKVKAASIHLDGEAGDIILQNGDAAEDFDVEESDLVEPGTVVVISENTKLHECRKGYDKRVAGVVAGAVEAKPGIILGRQASAQKRLPVALMGRVFCKADAQFGAIEVGDLLTTSPTAGHAMKATDPQSSFGAVLGKALGFLEHGRGFVPILVSLQ